MDWFLSYKADPRALPLANRHYNRQNPDSPQFAPPGKNLVLITKGADALWISYAPKYVDHAWKKAWVCTLFRNESGTLSSSLIRQALSATRAHFGDIPEQGMITFVNPAKVKKKRDPGRCFLKAGFKKVGLTKKHALIVLQILPEDMPEPEACHVRQLSLSLAV